MNIITAWAFGKSLLLSLAALAAVLPLFAWTPFVPPSFRHWIRHWSRVRESGCVRCVRDEGRILAERNAETARTQSVRRRSADLAMRSNLYLVGVRNRRSIATGVSA